MAPTQLSSSSTSHSVRTMAIYHGAAWALSSYCLVLAVSGDAHGASGLATMGWTLAGAAAFFVCGRAADTRDKQQNSVGWMVAFLVAAAVFFWWHRLLVGVSDDVSPFPRLTVALLIFGSITGLATGAARTWPQVVLSVTCWALTTLVAGALWRYSGYVLTGVMGAMTRSPSYGAAVGLSLAAGLSGYLSAIVALSISRSPIVRTG